VLPPSCARWALDTAPTPLATACIAQPSTLQHAFEIIAQLPTFNQSLVLFRTFYKLFVFDILLLVSSWLLQFLVTTVFINSVMTTTFDVSLCRWSQRIPRASSLGFPEVHAVTCACV